MAGVTLPFLLFLATLFGSFPLMAVVSHQQNKRNEPNFAAAEPKHNGLMLYAVDGSRVAKCERNEHTNDLTSCKIEDGYDLNDVMNAWLKAYEDR